MKKDCVSKIRNSVDKNSLRFHIEPEWFRIFDISPACEYSQFSFFNKENKMFLILLFY
jgi:hypothetical protein